MMLIGQIRLIRMNAIERCLLGFYLAFSCSQLDFHPYSLQVLNSKSLPFLTYLHISTCSQKDKYGLLVTSVYFQGAVASEYLNNSTFYSSCLN